MIKSLYYNKIITSIFMLLLSYQLAYSQTVSGPTPVEPNSTHWYSFYNGTTVFLPSWVVTGGTIISTDNDGGTYFYVEVLWGAAGTGNVAFKSKGRIPLGDMDVTIEVGGPTEPPTPDTVLSNENYIHTITPAIGVTDISLLSNDELMESVAYFDGLGRTKQTIAIKASPDKKDIITHADYDDFGRQAKDWLPYNDTIGDLGSYRGDISFDTQQYYELNYVDDFVGVTQTIDINSFSEKEIEPSPLNRVLKQSAPGKDWKLGNGHEIKFEYKANTNNEVKNFGVALNFVDSIYVPTLVLKSTPDNHYQSNELYKSVEMDENWEVSDGNNHTTEEFKDKHGRVLLKRTYESNIAHDTYYVYDDYGNLTYVLPPKMDASTSILDTIINNLDNLAYQYRYDRRNRLAEKKIPGKGLEYIVYNVLDKPILTKDAVLDAQGKWLFTKFDAYGRVAYTGLINSTSSRATLQQAANAANSQYVIKSDTSISIAGTTIYYDNGAYPTTISEIHTINYYDNYTFDKVSGNSETSYGITPITNVKGLSTGSKVRVLESSPVKWITTVSYYDTKSRPIYVYSFNDYLSATDKVKSKLDFIGNVEEISNTHARLNFDTITIVDQFDYDHMGRLTEQTQTIDGGIKEVIAQNTYDELGLLKAKGVGGDTTQVRLQTVDYTYNVRGWLKQINDVNNIGSDLFAFNLKYNDIADVSKRLYNGNISQTLWKTANTDGSLKDYEYTYDALNRITSAIGANTSNYNLNSVTYDKMGNILSLSRNGWQNTSTFTNKDVLTYSYYNSNVSNKLQKVLDNGNDNYGFKDGANLATEYTYDVNANLITDANKGITSILYNHLNLPTEIKFDNNNDKKINYTYSADGAKLRKVVNDGGAITTLDYAGNGAVYENNTLQFIPHAEGYITLDGSSWRYVYQYRDHIDNIRLSYSDGDGNGTISQSEIIQENNYQPFGLKMRGFNNNTNSLGNSMAERYMFGGKEFDDSFNETLNTYDFGARNYDPALGRWMNLDPLAEQMRRHSPYNYAFDNPIYFIDPDGMAPFGNCCGTPPTGPISPLLLFNAVKSLYNMFTSNSSSSSSKRSSSGGGGSSGGSGYGGVMLSNEKGGSTGDQNLIRNGGRAGDEIPWVDASGIVQAAGYAKVGKNGKSGDGKTNATTVSKNAISKVNDKVKDFKKGMTDGKRVNKYVSSATAGSLDSSNTAGEVSSEDNAQTTDTVSYNVHVYAGEDGKYMNGTTTTTKGLSNAKQDSAKAANSEYGNPSFEVIKVEISKKYE